MDRDLLFGATRLERGSFVASVASTESRVTPEDMAFAGLTTPCQAGRDVVTSPGLVHGDTKRFRGRDANAREQDDQSFIAGSTSGGALRPGGVPDLYSRENIGLLVQYAAVGLLYGSLPRTVYPFLNNYLRMNGYQTLSARVLLSLPWSIKVLIGIISDCFPICGSRRRAYMVLGWLLCSAMLLVLVVADQGKPYYVDRALRGKDLSNLSRTELQGRINWDAPKRGALYIVMMMLASCGYMIADVAADGLVVELAQREPQSVRGNVQSTIYLVRSVFMIGSALLVGIGMNGEDYGGTFTWSLSMAHLMLICCVLSLFAIPAAIFFIKEPIAPGDVTLRTYLAQLWVLLQNGAMLQIIAYRFFSGIFEGFTVTAGDPIQRYWAKVRPLNESLFSVVGLVVFSLALYFTKRFGLQWNWRTVIASTLIIVLCIDVVVSMLTVWDVVRNQWFWLGTPILEELPSAMSFLVSTFVVVEMAELGNEAAVYGLLTTISNLSAPFASCISKNVNALFDVSVDDIVRDTSRVRWEVTYTFLIAYVMKLLSLPWLVLLPRQKQDTQDLKRTARSSFVGGIMAVWIGLFAMIWSITTNLLSIFVSTACMKVAGGRGC